MISRRYRATVIFQKYPMEGECADERELLPGRKTMFMRFASIISAVSLVAYASPAQQWTQQLPTRRYTARAVSGEDHTGVSLIPDARNGRKSNSAAELIQNRERAY